MLAVLYHNPPERADNYSLYDFFLFLGLVFGLPRVHRNQGKYRLVCRSIGVRLAEFAGHLSLAISSFFSAFHVSTVQELGFSLLPNPIAGAVVFLYLTVFAILTIL